MLDASNCNSNFHHQQMLSTFAKWFIDGVILMSLIMGGTKKNAVSMASIYK